MGVVTFEVRGQAAGPEEPSDRQREGRPSPVSGGGALVLAALAALLVAAGSWISLPIVALRFAPSSHNFGQQALGSTFRQVFTLTAKAPAVLGGFRLSGPNPAEFDLEILTCTGDTLPADLSCQVAVAFTPQAEGFHDAEIEVLNGAGPGGRFRPDTRNRRETSATPLWRFDLNRRNTTSDRSG